jgi:DNA gyrase subunit A
LLTVRGDEDLMVITDKGMIIRTHLEQILTIGRDTQGVKIIQLNEGQKVANIAIVPRSDDVDEDIVVEEDDFSDDYQLDLDYQFMDDKE